MVWLITVVVALVVPAVAVTAGSRAAPAAPTPSPILAAPVTPALTFSAESDTFVSAEQSAQAHGDLPFMKVAAEPAQIALLRFRVTGLTGPIERATLWLSPVSGSSVGFDVQALTDTVWGEDTATYEHAPLERSQGGLAVTGSSGPLVPGQWTSVDVTSLIAANGPVSLVLTTVAPDLLLLASRESGSTGPRLEVEPGPGMAGQELLRAGDPVIAAAGDIACDPTAPSFSACRTQATSDLLIGSGLAAVLTLGDHQDEDGTLEKLLASYDPTWAG